MCCAGVPSGQRVSRQPSWDHLLGVQGQGQELPSHGTSHPPGVLQGARQTPMQHSGQSMWAPMKLRCSSCWSLPCQTAVQSLSLYTFYPQICLVNDPRPQNPYGKLYSVEFLGNMVAGRSTLYNNQPIQLLKKAAAESIKEGEVCCLFVKVPTCISFRSEPTWLLSSLLGGVVWLWCRETLPRQAGH